MNQYIPDITERFPEGYDGVDMTDSYFFSAEAFDREAEEVGEEEEEEEE